MKVWNQYTFHENEFIRIEIVDFRFIIFIDLGSKCAKAYNKTIPFTLSFHLLNVHLYIFGATSGIFFCIFTEAELAINKKKMKKINGKIVEKETKQNRNDDNKYIQQIT